MGRICLRRYLSPKKFISKDLFEQAESTVCEIAGLFLKNKGSGEKNGKELIFQRSFCFIFGMLSEAKFVAGRDLYTVAERLSYIHMYRGDESRSTESALYNVGIFAAAGVRDGLAILSGKLRHVGYNDAEKLGIPAEKVTRLADETFELANNRRYFYRTYTEEIMPAVVAQFNAEFGQLFPKPIESDEK